MSPHLAAAVAVTSGTTDICLLLSRIYIEMQKMNTTLTSLNEE